MCGYRRADELPAGVASRKPKVNALEDNGVVEGVLTQMKYGHHGVRRHYGDPNIGWPHLGDINSLMSVQVTTTYILRAFLYER